VNGSSISSGNTMSRAPADAFYFSFSARKAKKSGAKQSARSAMGGDDGGILIDDSKGFDM
jgi:hypothetical protein